MRLYDRIGDIIAANLNDLIDRFDDPELMLKQAIREMETLIDTATISAAKSIAAHRLLTRNALEHERNAQHWHTRAQAAVRNHDDDWARHAIIRSHDYEKLAQGLANERFASEQTTQLLRDQLAAMRAKLEEARQTLASLQARRQAVRASQALKGVSGSRAQNRIGFARFAQLRPKLEHAEHEANALVELCSGATSPLDELMQSREQAQHVETTLNEIKQRLATQ